MCCRLSVVQFGLWACKECSSVLDFLPTICLHIRLVPRYFLYYLYIHLSIVFATDIVESKTGGKVWKSANRSCGMQLHGHGFIMASSGKQPTGMIVQCSWAYRATEKVVLNIHYSHVSCMVLYLAPTSLNTINILWHSTCCHAW